MKAKTRITFLFGLLLLLVIAASCKLTDFHGTPTPSPTLTPTATAIVTGNGTPFPVAGDLGWGSVRGKVTDAVTGAPIANARIICEHHSYTSPAPCQGDAFTNQDGDYFFTNIFFHDTDTIHLSVTVPGYQPQEFEQSFFTQPELISNFALTPSPIIITPVVSPMLMCTPPLCAIGVSEVYYCAESCPGGCGTTCATFTPAP